MKNRILSILLVGSAAWAAAPAARAEAVPALSEALRAQISAVDRALAEGDSRSGDRPACRLADDSGADEAWYFRNFWLRLRGQFGFEVPGFAKVVVTPETELLFQRELPDGWAVYKPGRSGASAVAARPRISVP